MAMREPNLEAIGDWLTLFELAMNEARRVAGEWRDSAFSPHSTQPSSWSHSSRHSDESVR